MRQEENIYDDELDSYYDDYDDYDGSQIDNAFTKLLFTASNELDFENLKESLQLKKNFDADNDVIYFLEKDKYEIWAPDKDGGTDFILEQPHFVNIKINDERLSISLHLEDTHMLGHKFASKNGYIEKTIKDIAKENNCELLLVHSEDRFADRSGENYRMGYIRNFDKDGKDITPEEIKERNIYDYHRKDNIEDFSASVKLHTELEELKQANRAREKAIDDRNKFKESYSKTLEEQANSKSFKELLKEIKLDSIKDLAKDVIKRLGEDWNNPVTFLGEVKEVFKDDVEKIKSIKKAFKPKSKEKQQQKQDLER